MRPSRSPGFLALLALSAATLLPACKPAESGNQQAAAAPAASSAIPAPAPAGQARRIEIGVDNKGYHPASAPARGGEKLVLLFTRTEDSECVRQVIVDGKTVDLPLNQAVEIPTTMPADGDLVFTCGMKMFEGRVAVAR